MLRNHTVRLPKKPQKNVPSIVCEQCGKTLHSKTGLKEHIRCTHAKERKNVKCDICSRLVVETNYARHLRHHRNRERNICSICGFGLPTVHALNRHINTHTKKIEYPCDMCSKIFYGKGNLSHHKNIVHFGQKRFKCTFCDRSFGTSQTLRDHNFTHTGR